MPPRSKTSADKTPNVGEMTLKQLKEEVEKREIKVKGLTSKNSYICVINEYEALQNQKLQELREKITKIGSTFKSRKRIDLINFLLQHGRSGKKTIPSQDHDASKKANKYETKKKSKQSSSTSKNSSDTQGRKSDADKKVKAETGQPQNKSSSKSKPKSSAGEVKKKKKKKEKASEGDSGKPLQIERSKACIYDGLTVQKLKEEISKRAILAKGLTRKKDYIERLVQFDRYLAMNCNELKSRIRSQGGSTTGLKKDLVDQCILHDIKSKKESKGKIKGDDSDDITDKKEKEAKGDYDKLKRNELIDVLESKGFSILKHRRRVLKAELVQILSLMETYQKQKMAELRAKIGKYSMLDGKMMLPTSTHPPRKCPRLRKEAINLLVRLEMNMLEEEENIIESTDVDKDEKREKEEKHKPGKCTGSTSKKRDQKHKALGPQIVDVTTTSKHSRASSFLQPHKFMIISWNLHHATWLKRTKERKLESAKCNIQADLAEEAPDALVFQEVNHGSLDVVKAFVDGINELGKKAAREIFAAKKLRRSPRVLRFEKGQYSFYHCPGNDHNAEHHVICVFEDDDVHCEADGTLRFDQLSDSYTKMDYPPLTVVIADNRFQSTNLRRIALTSVHMPPKTKARQQVAQSNGFFKHYQSALIAAVGNKGKLPFTIAGENKLAAPHLVVGDWNHRPSPPSDWGVTGREGMITSSGGEGYDFCSYNQSLDRSRAVIQQQVLPLPTALKSNYRRGMKKVSDHDLIRVTLSERLDQVITEKFKEAIA